MYVFGLTNQVCKYFEFLCKTDLMFENLWRKFENLNFVKTGFKTCVFEKLCISCSCIWLISFNAWRILCKNWAFFQNCDFSRISIDWDCFSINQNWFKIFFFGEPLSVSINWNWFSINQKLWIKFFKNWVWLVQPHFSKVFQTFLSLFDLDKAHPQFFVVFLRSFCKVFLSLSR